MGQVDLKPANGHRASTTANSEMCSQPTVIGQTWASPGKRAEFLSQVCVLSFCLELMVFYNKSKTTAGKKVPYPHMCGGSNFHP